MAILKMRQADGTWADIPAIVGPRGKQGESGVYVGTDTPPESAKVWLNPIGEPTGTEDWEFDLDDGSTDTKTVVVINGEESDGRLAVLKFRQADGTWVDIPAIKGAAGPRGATGATGATGPTGAAFTYDMFTTEQLEGLKGPKGDKGDKGDSIKGDKGDKGDTGATGPQGPTGASGVHIGADNPPASANVWVNPSGLPTSTENWEFDLEDGSTDSKEVVVLNSDEANANGQLGILKVRNADGSWSEIPALVGPAGKDGTMTFADLTEEQKASLKGDKGESGVYVGSGEMPEGYNVQIDPNGSATDIIDLVIAHLPMYRGEVESL